MKTDKLRAFSLAPDGYTLIGDYLVGLYSRAKKKEK
jgi:hypothetical protein